MIVRLRMIMRVPMRMIVGVKRGLQWARSIRKLTQALKHAG
jgi:hypothetical protein